MTKSDSKCDNCGNLTKDMGYTDGKEFLKKEFYDMPDDMLHNHPHFFCEKHIGTMKPYSDKITGYK